jgi:hypothetical protein
MALYFATFTCQGKLLELQNLLENLSLLKGLRIDIVVAFKR